MAKKVGRKPNVSNDVIIRSIFESPDGALSAKALGITATRAGVLVEQDVLALRVKTAKVVDGEGNPQRGRPSHMFGLSKNARARARRLAAKAA